MEGHGRVAWGPVHPCSNLSMAMGYGGCVEEYGEGLGGGVRACMRARVCVHACEIELDGVMGGQTWPSSIHPSYSS